MPCPFPPTKMLTAGTCAVRGRCAGARRVHSGDAQWKGDLGNKWRGNRSTLGTAGSAIVLHLGTRPRPSLFTGSPPAWPALPYVATGLTSHSGQAWPPKQTSQLPPELWRHVSHRSQLGWPGDSPINSIFPACFSSYSKSSLPQKATERVQLGVSTTDSQGQGEEQKGMKEKESNTRKP